MRIGRSGRLSMAAMLATSVAGLSGVVAAQGQAGISYDMPAQSLAAALATVAQRNGLRLVYGASLSAGRMASPMHGTYKAEQAIGRLLIGSGLTYRFTKSGTVTIAPADVTASTPAASSGVVQLDAIDVQGNPQSPVGPGVGYVATRSLAASKSDLPILETPQSVSVVSRKQLDDQDVQTVAQALRYTPGVVPEVRGSWSRYDQFNARGFELDANEFLDGLRFEAGYQATPQMDPYLLDRIEVVRGPASVLYGALLPGGLLNMVSKRPTSTPFHEIGLQTGSYGDVQGTFDLSGPVVPDGSQLYRIAGIAYSTGSQVDHELSQRIAIAPSFTWAPDAGTSLTVLTSYQNDPAGGFYDFLPYQGTVVSANGVKIPTNFYTGDLGFNRFQRNQGAAGYAFEHHFDDVWTVRQNFRYLHVGVRDYLLQGAGWDKLGSTLSRDAWNNREQANTVTLDNQAEAKFALGPTHHTALIGIDYQRIQADERYGTGDAPDLDLFAPDYRVSIDPVVDQRNFNQIQTQTGLYGQDQVRLGNWAFLGGLRQDWTETNTHRRDGIASNNLSNNALTWRTGLVYLFDNGIAPYASYATSFNPQAGSYYDGTPFKPNTGEQFEAGLKYQPPGMNSLFTASYFDLTERNVPTADPDPTHGPFAEIQTGAIKARGVELEAHTNITDAFSLIATYAHQDSRVTEDTNYKGRVPVQVPTNTASLWGNYDVHGGALTGLGFGAGIRYIGATFADQENTLRVPGFTVVDAALRYDLGAVSKGLAGAELALNVSNLFDRTYVSSCDSADTCYYGLRRTVFASLKYRW